MLQERQVNESYENLLKLLLFARVTVFIQTADALNGNYLYDINIW